jgi:glutathione synthase
MKKNILIIADPLEKVKPNSDSSLALAQVALESFWKVFWCESDNIHVIGEKIFVNNLFELTSVSISSINYKIENKKKIPLSDFSYCFVRKDPPFDENYKDLCWILASQSEVKIINPAETLLAYHEKALQWRAFSERVLSSDEIIPTCLSSSIDIIEDYCNENQSILSKGIVCKPWLGHGGESVELYKNKESLFVALKNILGNQTNLQRVMVQPFLEEIHSEGDRRVLIANGEIIGDFVRIPANGKIASNLAQGGRAVIRDMTLEQKEICQKIAVFLKQKNIGLAGLDLIGCRIGEINITSPTGLRTYEMLTGTNIAQKAFQLLVN